MKNIIKQYKHSNPFKYKHLAFCNFKFSSFIPKKVEYKFIDELEKILKNSEIENEKYMETVNKYDSLYKQEFLKNNDEMIRETSKIMDKDEFLECDDLVDELLSFTNTEMNLFKLVIKENANKSQGFDTTILNETYPFINESQINIFPIENSNWSKLSNLNIGNGQASDTKSVKQEEKKVEVKVEEPKAVSIIKSIENSCQNKIDIF